MKETNHVMEKGMIDVIYRILCYLPKQSERLLLAFLHADGHYLSHR
jgi:hypothetical protein